MRGWRDHLHHAAVSLREYARRAATGARNPYPNSTIGPTCSFIACGATMLSRFPWFTHYASRKLEWLISIYTIWFGVMLALPMHSMTSLSFIGALAIFDETSWGVTYACIGALHCYSLHINGMAPWTPFARLAALFLNANAFLAMALSLLPANPWGTGVLTYGFLAVGFCGAALYSAAQDCGREVKIWRAARNAKH